MPRTLSVTLVLLALATVVGTTRAEAAPPPSAIVIGMERGWPEVRGYDRFGAQSQTWTVQGNAWPFQLAAYSTYQRGVRVAVGDVVGDARPEIVTAPGSDDWSDINVFDGRTFERVRSFPALPFVNWWNGTFVAAGDVAGDAQEEAIVGLDRGCCTSVGVWDARTPSRVSSFFPFDTQTQTGAHVATADLGGDGKSEILAVALGSQRINAYGGSGGPAFRSFEPFGIGAVGAIAAGNVVGDARAEVVAGATTADGLRVRVLDALTGSTVALLAPFGSLATSDTSLAVADVDGDGGGDVVALARTSGGTKVAVVSGTGLVLGSFFVTDPSIAPGATVAAGDLDGDGEAEIVVGGGPTGAPAPPYAAPDQRVAVFDRTGLELGSFAAYPGTFQGGVRVAEGDVAGDAAPEVVTAPGPGMEAEIGVYSHEWRGDRDRGNRLAHFAAFEPSFLGGASVATGQLDADGNQEIAVGSGPGRPAEVRIFNEGGRLVRAFAPFEASYSGGVEVATGERDADAAAELVVTSQSGAARVRVFDGTGSLQLQLQPAGYDAGVRAVFADTAGDGEAELVLAPRGAGTPWLTLLDRDGKELTRFTAYDGMPAHGVHVAAGDVDEDGRDEIVVTPGEGGPTDVRIFKVTGRTVRRVRVFWPYPFRGPGLNVAVRTRTALPIAATARTARVRVGSRRPFVLAYFLDAGLELPVSAFAATVDWPSGARTVGRVVHVDGLGQFEVRVVRRFAKPGRYAATVTLTDTGGRVSVARSVVVVRR